MAFAAFGAVIFGLRDLLARAGPDRPSTPPEDLVSALPARQTVLVTGATGFIGRRLVQALTDRGPPGDRAGARPCEGRDADAAVPARSPACRSFPTTRRSTRSSISPASRSRTDCGRLQAPPNPRLAPAHDRQRGAADPAAAAKPAVLVNASAIGWYGAHEDEILTEANDGRPSFGHSVCGDWERAAVQAERFGVRVVRLRIGLVLGTEGGMLAQLLVPFEYGLGGPIGSGRQWMSWIALDDMVRLIAHAIATPSLTGAVNATAPEPVRNATFAHELGRALHRPAFLRLPAAPLRLARRRHGRGPDLSGARDRPGQGAEERLRVPPCHAARRRSRRFSAQPAAERADTRRGHSALRHAGM